MLTRIAGSHSSTRNSFTVVFVSETNMPLRSPSRIAANAASASRPVRNPPRETCWRLPVAVGSQLRPEVPLVTPLPEVTLHCQREHREVRWQSVSNGRNGSTEPGGRITISPGHNVVRATGIEPARLSTPGPKSRRKRFSGGGEWWEMVSEEGFC